MSGWTFDYRDVNGLGISSSSGSKEAAFDLAADRQNHGDAILGFKGPDGKDVPLKEFEAWKAARQTRR